MSLTLARLCGEWQLVSGNYEAWGACGGKYEAQIVIFCILAAVNRFSRISRKSESRRGKLEQWWWVCFWGCSIEKQWWAFRRARIAVERHKMWIFVFGSLWATQVFCSLPSGEKEELGFELYRPLVRYSNARQTRWVGFSAKSTVSRALSPWWRAHCCKWE